MTTNLKCLVFIWGTIVLAASCKKKDDPAALPQINTAAVTNITDTSATGGGTIINDGGAFVFASGICFSSTNDMPDVTDDTIKGTTALGNFSSNMTRLIPNTSYYVRAYAINSVGVAYGKVVDFTTAHVSNAGPLAIDVGITGNRTVGQVLTARYTYYDLENDPESGTTFQWYKANDTAGAQITPVANATARTYTLTAADENKFFKVGVIPGSSSGKSPGAEMRSYWAGPVHQNAAPLAIDISITGKANVLELLMAHYTFYDLENDLENGTTFQWYAAGDTTGAPVTAITNARRFFYTLTAAELNKFIRIGIVPGAATGTSPGMEMKSYWIGPVAGPVQDSVSFIYNGQTVTYNIITSPKTGRKWLDRNLGAPNAPGAYDDWRNQGDLFQWGREADGHQLINRAATNSGTTAVNGTTTTLSTTDVPGHALFITPSADPFDWRSPQNPLLWMPATGLNNVCPTGFHVPTKGEWEAEQLGKLPDAYTQLRITTGGARNLLDGSFSNTFTDGQYWSSTIWNGGGGTYGAWSINFSNFGNAYTTTSSLRATGLSVRCIKD